MSDVLCNSRLTAIMKKIKLIVPYNMDEQKYPLGEKFDHEYCLVPDNDEHSLYSVAKSIKGKAASKCLILIDEYLKFRDGNREAGAIDLITMLRIIGVKSHIVFATLNKEIHVSCKSASNFIMFSKGISVWTDLLQLKKAEETNIEEHVRDTSDDGVRKYIRAGFSLPEDERHNWANIWGVTRLVSAYNVLHKKKVEMCPASESRTAREKTRKYEQFRESAKSLNYQRALYIYDIDQDINNGGVKLKSELERTKDIVKETRKKIDQSISILYVDDQANAGWEAIFQKIIYDNPKKGDFCSISIEENDSIESIYQKISEAISDHSPDLILLDLRLKNETGIYWDVGELSGAKILKKIREEHPGLPVMITTASNKSWSHLGLQKLGADAHWIKEGLDTTASLGSSDNVVYCLQNYHDFLQNIKQIQGEEYSLLRKLGRLKIKLASVPETNLDNLDSDDVQTVEGNEAGKHVEGLFYLYTSYLQISLRHGDKEKIEPLHGYWYSLIMQQFRKLIDMEATDKAVIDISEELNEIHSRIIKQGGLVLNCRHKYMEEFSESYNDVYIRRDINLLCSMISMAKFYKEVREVNLPGYALGELGEVYAAIKYGIKRHRTGAEGSDGKIGNDYVEIKTITPDKKRDEVLVSPKGNFGILVVVKITKDLEFESRIKRRAEIPELSKITNIEKKKRINWKSLL